MKITVSFTVDVDPSWLPREDDPDKEKWARFIRRLVNRRTEGPWLDFKITRKYAFSIFPEPAGKQLPMLDLMARAEEDEAEQEEEDELEREASV